MWEEIVSRNVVENVKDFLDLKSDYRTENITEAELRHFKLNFWEKSRKFHVFHSIERDELKTFLVIFCRIN